ncbi:MAG: ABC transporter permease [Chloroflexota bacterium]|nr:ABC transporter permease [Chloroflexota bacterium]MDE3193399.1 ABC transporter permease [Chloroflexota bacterium]
MAGQAVAVAVPPAVERQRGQWRLAFERFRAHRPALAGIAVIALLAFFVVAVPVLSPYDAESPKLLEIFEPPSLAHPMGTDSLGRDLATRILYGGRVSLAVGLLAVAVAITVGTLVGMTAGFYGGWVDTVLMRTVDLVYSIPSLFLLILLGVYFRGLSVAAIILVLGLLRWMTTARLVRAQFLSLKEREFVEAARCVGARDLRIIVRHLLPNSLAPIIVTATLGVAGAIIAESTLSFLGLGIQPPTPSWGNMLMDATQDMEMAPWTAIFPGFFIFVAVVSINFVGDGLRDALDPRHVVRKEQ